MSYSPYAVATEAKLAMADYAISPKSQKLILSICADARGETPDAPGARSAASDWIKVTRTALLEGVPHYVSPEVCEALTAAAPGIPDWELRREDVHTPIGWVYFARSLHLDRDEDHAERLIQEKVEPDIFGDLIGITWSPIQIRNDETGVIVSSLNGATGLSIQFYVRSKLRDEGIPIATLTWEFGQSLNQLFEAGRATFGVDGQPLIANTTYQELRYFAALMAFMGQEIFPTRREQLPRDARKRLARAGYDPGADELQPRVVYLRRVTQRPNDETQERVHRDFDHRFWVKGHWRNQWYETEQRHKPIWIHPFVKGPEGKPIAPRRTELVAVVR